MLVDMVELKLLLWCIAFSIGLSSIFIIISRILIPRNYQGDKSKSYECGFQPFSSVSLEFDVQFYVVALLFLLFDVELMLLFPWCVNFVIMYKISTVSVSIFILFLFTGIIYEWVNEGLVFDKKV